MMTDAEMVKAGFDAALAPVRDTFNRLLGPVADELGGVLADPVRVFRFRRSVRLLEKVKRIAEEAGFELKAVPLKTLLPILENASLEDDDDLHDRWASLLANSAHPEQAVHVQPSFPDILRQLSSLDAKLLDAICGFVIDSHRRHFALDSPLDANRAQYEPILSPDSMLPGLFAKAGLAHVAPSELYTSNPPRIPRRPHPKGSLCDGSLPRQSSSSWLGRPSAEVEDRTSPKVFGRTQAEARIRIPLDGARL